MSLDNPAAVMARLAEEQRLCGCGCGNPTPLIQRNSPKRGYVKGRRHRFLPGHWAKANRKPDYTVEDRGHETACWVWAKVLNHGGYGQTHVTGLRGMHLAHRVYYERAHGPVPTDLQLDHLCRVRACVNPAHLEPVRRVENVRRGINAKLTESDARAIRSSDASHAALALIFGVSKATIQDIRAHRTWREVTQ